MAVRTILPRHSTSRGNPTFSESSRAMNSGALGTGGAVAPLQDLVGVQASVNPVLLDGLTRLESEFPVVEEDVDLVRLEGDEVGDARDLGPRPDVGPRGSVAATTAV